MVVDAIIIFFYILQHFSSALLLRKSVQTVGLFLVLGVIGYTSIYYLKSPSYDLLIYVDAFSYAAIFEPGYYLLSLSLKTIGLSNELALTVIRLVLAFLFIYPPIRLVKKEDNILNSLVLTLIIISTVAFTLGVNNVLRQGFSSLFIMLSIYHFLNDKKILFIIFAFLAVMFHLSAPFFLLYALFIYYLIQSLYGGHLAKIRLPRFSSGVNRVVIFLVPILGIILLLMATQFIFSSYLAKNMAAGDTERTSAIVKTAFVYLVFIASEFTFGKYSPHLNSFTVLRFFRLAFISLVLWLSLNPMFNELASRVLYFYFVVEMFVLLHAYQKNKITGVVITLISYGFALNAINILTGGP